MNGLEIAAIITAIGGLIGLYANARKIGELFKRIEDSEKREAVTRRDIVILGENFAATRADNMILAEAFNAMWLEFYNVTGKRPAANLSMLNRLTTLRQNETGRLTPLSAEMIESIRRAQ